MNKLLISLAAFLLIPVCFSLAQTQSDNQGKSNIEMVSERSGTLLKTTSIYIGALDELNVETYRIRDLATSDSLAGIRFYRQTDASNKKQESVYVDSDEVASIINALSFLSNKTATKVPTTETKYIFHSRSGFRIVLITQTKFIGAKPKWVGYVGLDEPLYTFAPENFTKLKDLIVQAKAKM